MPHPDEIFCPYILLLPRAVHLSKEEYFATQAYQALKAGGAAGTTPRVDKISTPGHNWVIVNHSSDASSSPHWVAVDYWLLALGFPKTGCICAWDKMTPLRFSEPFKVIETFNPDNQT